MMLLKVSGRQEYNKKMDNNVIFGRNTTFLEANVHYSIYIYKYIYIFSEVVGHMIHIQRLLTLCRITWTKSIQKYWFNYASNFRTMIT